MNALPSDFGYRLARVDGRSSLKQIVLTKEGHIHRPLSHFSYHLAKRYPKSTVQTYLYALMRYFAYLDSRSDDWLAPPEEVRAQIESYLLGPLNCFVREHSHGFLYVSLKKDNRTQVTQLLAALRHFYTLACDESWYQYTHPLLQENADDDLAVSDEEFPKMPVRSGVEEPPDPRKRLTQTYFVLAKEQWVPHVIDDPTFPTHVINAGMQTGWNVREQIVTRLLFETGARISEICSLSLGDWFALGLRCDATLFNKGSNGRRVKNIRFSETTSKLLRQYFDQDRRRLDFQQWRVHDYIHRHEPEDLYSVPIFITKQQTALTARTFRDLYWNPACRAMGIRANVHQARHWFVTCAIREIHEHTREGPERDRRLNELIVYMAWRRGHVTLASYNHHFDIIRFATIQAGLHSRLDKALAAGEPAKEVPRHELQPIRSPEIGLPSDPDWDFLSGLGSNER